MPTPDPALASALRLSIVRVARRLRAERSDTALGLSQLSALASIERHGPLTPRELAAIERVQPPSLTPLLSSLCSAGLVGRQAHPHDGRQVLLEIRAEGVALLRADRRRREQWLDAQLRTLAPADLDVLRRASVVLDALAAR